MSIGSLLQSLFVRITSDSSGLDRDLESLGGRISKTMTSIGTKMAGVGALLSVGVTAPLMMVGQKAVAAARDVGEMQSAFNYVFGQSAKDVEEWARRHGDAVGRATHSLQQGALQFQQMFKQMVPDPAVAAEMSKTLAELAVDLGSFYNVSDEDAFSKISAALRGESEPIRAFGVLLDEATVKAKAYAMGLAAPGSELTQQQKVLARYQSILDATKDAQGDAARTAGSLANQQRAAKAAYDEAMVSIGQAFLPIMTQLAKVATDVMNQFNGLSESTRQFIIIGGVIVAALGPVLTVLGAIITIGGTLIPLISGWVASFGAAAAAAGGFAALLTPLLPIIAGVAAAIAAAYAVWKNWDTISPMLQNLGKSVMDAIGPSVVNLFNALKDAALALWNSAFGERIREVITTVVKFQMLIAQAFGSALPGIFRALGAAFSAVFDMIAATIRFVVALLSGDWQGAWNAAKEFVAAFARGVGGILGNLTQAAIAFMAQMVNGIKGWVGDQLDAVWNRVKAGVDRVKGFFWGLYDAVIGHSYIPDMVDGIAAQIARLDAVMVEPVRKSATAAADAFKQLQGDVRSLLASLFPDEARYLEFQRNHALIDEALRKNVISAETAAEAMKKLRAEYFADPGLQLETVGDDAIAKPGPIDLQDLMKNLPQLPDFGGNNEKLNAGLGKTLGTVADLISGFKSLEDVAVESLSQIGSQLLNKVLPGLGDVSMHIESILRSVIGLFKGKKKRKYNDDAYTKPENQVCDPMNQPPSLTQIVQVHANDAVLASTVRKWVGEALVEAREAVPRAVGAALDLVPAEMGRDQQQRFY